MLILFIVGLACVLIPLLVIEFTTCPKCHSAKLQQVHGWGDKLECPHCGYIETTHNS